MKNSLSFLKKLKKNNNTEWMHAHKDEYLTAKKEFEFLTQELIHRIGEFDSNLPYLEPKHCTFRLNRDVRFSNNKDPYKENFGAFMAYGGKKSGLPGYYLHVSPKEIFVAAGAWMPEPDKLVSVRRHIMNDGDELLKILNDKKFKKIYSAMDTELLLKRPPKGFPADHEYIELLKYKSFTVSHKLKMEDALKPNFGKVVADLFKVAKPFNQFFYEGMKV